MKTPALRHGRASTPEVQLSLAPSAGQAGKGAGREPQGGVGDNKNGPAWQQARPGRLTQVMGNRSR